MKTHLDLFSGIGGFAIAAQWAGFQTIAFCEIEPYAQQVLIEKFGAVLADTGCHGGKSKRIRGKRDGSQEEMLGETHQRKRIWSSPANCCENPTLHSDIFTLDGTQYRGVTLLTGGFPCQPFSCAGKRRGKEDDRHLWPEMLRVIAEARPAYVLAENVPGIINMELDHCLSDLEAIGYATGTLVVPACAVDARHRRDRVWVLGTRTLENANCCGNSQPRIQQSNLPAKPSEDVSKSNISGPQGRDGEELRECSCERVVGTGDSYVAYNGSDNNGRTDRVGRGQREQEEGISDARGGRGQEDVLREPQRRLGGVVDGLPNRMDECCRWPEEDPQIPRVSKGVKNRTHRLRALGNAIVPQVAYQILKALP